MWWELVVASIIPRCSTFLQTLRSSDYLALNFISFIMSTTRYHPQHPLPAPVVHQAFSVPQSKSHVLAGVQDAYWSDDENVCRFYHVAYLQFHSYFKITGRRGMSSLFGRNGYFRFELQTLCLWLSGIIVTCL